MSLLDLARPALDNLSPEEKLRSQVVAHRLEHYLYPPFFLRYQDLPELTWSKVSFTPESRAELPRRKGVYAFAVELSFGCVPPITHILYIGKAGDINTNNTIYERYYDYIRTKRVNDRPSICQMLRMWDGHLTYYYAVVEDHISTGEIEKTLLDILIPPYNRGDYSAEIKSLLRGANIL
ncbi:MAG: hypothetical protein ACRCRW_09630 [Aeromonadaceae bacterium]